MWRNNAISDGECIHCDNQAHCDQLVALVNAIEIFVSGIASRILQYLAGSRGVTCATLKVGSRLKIEIERVTDQGTIKISPGR